MTTSNWLLIAAFAVATVAFLVGYVAGVLVGAKIAGRAILDHFKRRAPEWGQKFFDKGDAHGRMMVNADAYKQGHTEGYDKGWDACSEHVTEKLQTVIYSDRVGDYKNVIYALLAELTDDDVYGPEDLAEPIADLPPDPSTFHTYHGTTAEPESDRDWDERFIAWMGAGLEASRSPVFQRGITGPGTAVENITAIIEADPNLRADATASGAPYINFDEAARAAHDKAMAWLNDAQAMYAAAGAKSPPSPVILHNPDDLDPKPAKVVSLAIKPGKDHRWTGQMIPGTPNEPTEYVAFCDDCGMEYPGSADDIPACVDVDDDLHADRVSLSEHR